VSFSVFRNQYYRERLACYESLDLGRLSETELINVAGEACQALGYGIVVVLGHPNYYPRFGFSPSKPFGIVWEHDAPEEAFMVKELREGVLARRQGVVRYRPEFEAV
jgi:putative acetyltransferase